ncbi:MAG: YqgE/AlgH family protein [Gammaproteobacteria bacterium]|nr:YqgE/AlgH family protein [Gammaproteobacteria bacterium]
MLQRVICLPLAAALLCLYGAAHAREPAAGLVLVAARDTGGVFRESIVYLLSHDEHGSLGVIVNRPTKATLTDLLPKFAELEARSHRILYGGPVGLRALKFLVRTHEHPGDAVRIDSDIFASGSPELLETLLQADFDPAALRVFVGYAGWAPDQLNQELARTAWYVVQLTTEEIFTADEGLWKRLISTFDPPGIRTRMDTPLRAVWETGTAVPLPSSPSPPG